MKKSLFSLAVLSLSIASYAQVDILLENGDAKTLSKELKLEKLKLGSDQDNGESVAKVIAFINKHREEIVGENAPKIYFRPHFDGDKNSKQGRIYHSNGTASIRLEQSVYFEDEKGNRQYIPFDGAEVNAYITGLKEKDNGNATGGRLVELSSSLVPVDFKLIKRDTERKLDIPKTISNDIKDRVRLLDILEMKDTEGLGELMGLDKSSYGTHQAFVKTILEDESIFTKIVSDNQNRMSPIFVKNKAGVYNFAWRIRGLYGLPLDLDLNLHDKGPIIVGFQTHQKDITVNIYTGSTFNLKKKKRRSGKSYVWKDREVEGGLFKQEDYDLALINLSKVVEYFKGEFNWNSFDNRGSDLNATVRFKGSRLLGSSGLRQNAAWAGPPYNQFLFGRGGETLGDFLNAFDVIGHEFCHAIVTNTANLDSGNQPGALNEHICDILGVGFEGDLSGTGFDYKIGEKVVLEGNKGLRDFLNPADSFSDQPGHMSQVNQRYGTYCVPTGSNDKCGVHYSNGVLNLAVAKMVQENGWPKMKALVFEVLTKKLRSSSDFTDYKTQMIRTCSQNSYFSAANCASVRENFEKVGLSAESSNQSASDQDQGTVDYEQQICEIVKDICVQFPSSATADMCKKCGF